MFVRFMKLKGKRLPIYIGAICLSAVGEAVRRIANSYLIKTVVTSAHTGVEDTVIWPVLGNFAVFVLGLVLWRIGIIRYNIEGRTAAGQVEKLVFSKAMRLPMSYYEKNHSSDFMSKLIYDTQKASDIYTSRLRRLLTALICTVMYLVPMLYFSWELTLCLIGLSLLALGVNRYLAKPVKTIGAQLSDKNSKMLEKMTNILSGMELIKIFPVAMRISSEYTETADECYRVQKKANGLSAVLECMNNMLDLIGTLAFLGLGVWFVSIERITLGELTALYTLYGSFRNVFSEIGLYFPQMMNCISNVEKVFAFLDLEEEPVQWEYELAGQEEKQENKDIVLSVENISFGYDADRPVLDNFSMEVKKGSFTAVVGESGCGKSTLAKLLLGFYPLERGSVTVAGRSYSGLTLKEVREQISYVPQEPYLYETTIAENIACGRKGERKEIVAAAKAANAHEFIMKLPNGYDTVLGERGNTLSGGERQRIAIARAIIRDTPIIVLDEATSALDNESETLVQEAIKGLKGHRTILMIAHRPSSIAMADEVIRLG